MKEAFTNHEQRQRSIDITESFTNSKLKVRAKMQQLKSGNIEMKHKSNSSIMNDLMADSIRASQ